MSATDCGHCEDVLMEELEQQLESCRTQLEGLKETRKEVVADVCWYCNKPLKMSENIITIPCGCRYHASCMEEGITQMGGFGFNCQSCNAAEIERMYAATLAEYNYLQRSVERAEARAEMRRLTILAKNDEV